MAIQHEWVEVLVPKELVPDVYGLIANRMARGALDGGSIKEELFARMYIESPPAMRKFLEVLAIHPGKELTTADICKALSLTPPQLAGVLGAFGRRRKNRYKGAQRPFAARWDHTEGSWTYRMEPDVGEVVTNESRAAAKAR